MMKLTTYQQEQYQSMVNDAVKHGTTIVSGEGIRKTTITKLITVGMIERTGTKRSYYSGRPIPQYHISDSAGLMASYSDHLKQERRESERRALRRERYAILAEHKKQQIMERYNLAPQQVEVTAKLDFLSYRHDKSYTEYTICLKVLRSSSWETTPGVRWEDWVTIYHHQYDKPEISSASTTFNKNLAMQVGSLMVIAAQIIQEGLYK
jgi:hypothetical protein